MFSFHKPKIYRSLQGCCICRAKSSSSRFTDSKRYETDFFKCFQIDEHRSGEICNACVLLVKRWKKLPSGSIRNWNHVVDARAGPGTKSMNRIKNRLKEEKEKTGGEMKKLGKHKHKKRPRPSNPNNAPGSPGGLSDDILIGQDCISDGSNSDYMSGSEGSDDEQIPETEKTKGSRKQVQPTRNFSSSFLDLTYWKKEEICCGTIFKGANGEVLLDTSLWRPCGSCKPSSRSPSRASSPCGTVTPPSGSMSPATGSGGDSQGSVHDDDSNMGSQDLLQHEDDLLPVRSMLQNNCISDIKVEKSDGMEAMDDEGIDDSDDDDIDDLLDDDDDDDVGDAVTPLSSYTEDATVPLSYNTASAAESTASSTPASPSHTLSLEDSVAQLECAAGIVNLSSVKAPLPVVALSPRPIIQMEV